jgi:hypothetical protein
MKGASAPAGTHAGQTEPLASVAAWNFVLVRDDFPVADAYLLARTVLAGDARAVIGAAAAGTRAEHLRHNTLLPVHPGALKYYRERGL